MTPLHHKLKGKPNEQKRGREGGGREREKEGERREEGEREGRGQGMVTNIM